MFVVGGGIIGVKWRITLGAAFGCDGEFIKTVVALFAVDFAVRGFNGLVSLIHLFISMKEGLNIGMQMLRG